MLLDLCSATTQLQSDLLFEAPCTKRDHNQLMEVVDRINARYGKSTVHVASTGHTQKDGPDGHPNSPVYGHLKLPHLN